MAALPGTKRGGDALVVRRLPAGRLIGRYVHCCAHRGIVRLADATRLVDRRFICRFCCGTLARRQRRDPIDVRPDPHAGERSRIHKS